MNKLEKFFAAAAAVLVGFTAGGARAAALTPSADDYANIVNALALAEDGGVVELGTGTFAVTNTIALSRDVTLKGASRDGTILDFGQKCGGFVLSSDGATVASLTIYRGKSSGNGGGVNMTKGQVTNCWIRSCTTTVTGSNNGGGGIFMTGGTVADCEFTGCYYNNLYTQGNALYQKGGTVTRCDFHGNDGGYGHGNAAYGSHAVHVNAGTLSSSRIHHNSTWLAGLKQSGGTVVNCLIYGNTTMNASGAQPKDAAGVYKTGGTMLYCTVYGNVNPLDTTGCSGIAQSGGSSVTRYCISTGNGPSGLSLGSNRITGGTFTSNVVDVALASFTENRVGDPDFVAADAGDFRIAHATSPAVGYGKPAASAPADIAGNARSATAPTAGAFEYHGVTVRIPEIKYLYANGERLVADIPNGEDYAVLENNGGTSPGFYPVVVGLTTDGARWADGTTDNKTLRFEIRAQTTLQPTDGYEEIAAAIAGVENGETILFAPGTYTVTNTIDLSRPVTLKGSGRDDVILDFGKKCRGVYMTSAGAVLEGVTVTKASYNAGKGGGVYMTGGTIRDCRVTSCTVGDTRNGGGGIYMTGGTVAGCEIDGCSFGGLYGHGNAIWMNGGTVTNCDIHANNGGYSHDTVAYGGGVIYLEYGTVICSKIHDNNKDSISGIHQKGGSVINCLFYNNTAKKGAAGIYMEKGTAYDCTIYNCIRTGDTAGQSGYYQSDGTTKNCIIWNCHPTSSTAGSVYVGGGTFANNVTEVAVAKATDAMTGDPAFFGVVSNDFRITRSSSAYRTGVPLASVKADYAGVARDAEHPCVGAYEYDPGIEVFELNIKFDKRQYPQGSDVEAEAVVTGVGDAELPVAWTLDGAALGTTDAIVTLEGLSAGAHAIRAEVIFEGRSASKEASFVILPTKVYVNNTGSGVYPFATAETGTNSFEAAFAALWSAADVTGEVVIAEGVYTNVAAVSFLNPVNVHGEGMDLTRIVCKTRFMPFTLSNKDAILSGLTVSDGYRGASMSGGRIVGCRFLNCGNDETSYSTGGGVNISGGTVADCFFEGCFATGLYGGGGGAYLTGGTVTNCVFTNCQSGGNVIYDAGGGAVSLKDGGMVTHSRFVDCKGSVYPAFRNNGGTVRNVLVTGTKAGQTAAALQDSGTTESCTLCENAVLASTGTVHVAGGTFRNNIVWGNSGIVELSAATDAAIRHCCYPGAEDGVNGNIARDPQLKADGTVRSSSPCRNAGTNQAWMAESVDLAGNQRILNKVVDIGCFENAAVGFMFFVR